MHFTLPTLQNDVIAYAFRTLQAYRFTEHHICGKKSDLSLRDFGWNRADESGRAGVRVRGSVMLGPRHANEVSSAVAERVPALRHGK